MRPRVLSDLRAVRPGVAEDSELEALNFQQVAEEFIKEQQNRVEALVLQRQRHLKKLAQSASKPDVCTNYYTGCARALHSCL